MMMEPVVTILVVLTFLLPLAGTLILAFAGNSFDGQTSAATGVTSVALAALSTALLVALSVDGTPQTVHLWTWIHVGDFQPTISVVLDALSLTMMAVITGVGFLIHLFAAWYMRGEEGITRFYAYMNLFVFSMLLLVMADNLLLLYLGWEGVGLCSYLLIGYYYQKAENGRAAFKAFLVTRIGDVFLALGLFLLFTELGTLNISELLVLAPQAWETGSPTANLTALLLLGGALGKSAQLPLHTWLPDAMAGPTPVSALIHAATMVTAGVYLIARLHGIFTLAPDVLFLVGVIGAVSMLLAAFAALAQTDIKRVLAFSTMSQIGYMFIALGVGAFDVAIFHLVTHAFFKALLFLSAGSVIVSCHHEQDIRHLGDLWHRLPVAWCGFLFGGSALVALPLISAGYYSKDEILWEALAAGEPGLMLAGLLGAVLTCLYTVRLILGIFHGPMNSNLTKHAEPGRGWVHHLPLLLLALLSTTIGAWLYPGLHGGVLPPNPGESAHGGHTTVAIIASATVIAGLLLAGWLFIYRSQWLERQVAGGAGARLWRLWHAAWGFDSLFDTLFVRPWQASVRWLRNDRLDQAMSLSAVTARWLNAVLLRSQTGRLRHYLVIMVLGVTLVLLFLALAPSLLTTGGAGP